MREIGARARHPVHTEYAHISVEWKRSEKSSRCARARALITARPQKARNTIGGNGGPGSGALVFFPRLFLIPHVLRTTESLILPSLSPAYGIRRIARERERKRARGGIAATSAKSTRLITRVTMLRVRVYMRDDSMALHAEEPDPYPSRIFPG